MEDEPLNEEQLARAHVWKLMLDEVGKHPVQEDKPWSAHVTSRPGSGKGKGTYERPLCRNPNQHHPFSRFNI